MFEIRRVVVHGSMLSAALLLAGTLPGAGCTGDNGAPGAKGDNGDPGAAGGTGSAGSQGPAGPAGAPPTFKDPAAAFQTQHPQIKHVVVIFGENVSFDHYFATYPNAINDTTTKETPFVGVAPAQGVNNLKTPLDVNNNFMPLLGANLLGANPNKLNPANVTDANAARDPFRLTPSQASTSSQNHSYVGEQQAANAGAMDLFPSKGGTANTSNLALQVGNWLVLGYFDGNTVSAMWNYAQHFAMNDNSWSTQFGPSTPGALNLISGQTNGAVIDPLGTGATQLVDDGHNGNTVVGDPQPGGDACSDATRQQVHMTGKNIGDLLNEKNITWGAFMGGFDLTIVNPNGTFGCGRKTKPTQQPFAGQDQNRESVDYIPHHAWFQFYQSTANLMHLRPNSLTDIGHSKLADGATSEPANHNYDSHDFFDALAVGNLPAVSFLKAPAYQDGHGQYSNPIDEQSFIISVVNTLQKSPFWSSTAVILAYDDSDGWYDHQAPPILSQSSSPADQLNGAGSCTGAGAQQGKSVVNLNGATAGVPVLGRCGYGTRIPLLVVSPFARKNFVDHTLTDQTSILKFIEDNWLSGKRIQDGGSFDTIAGSIEGMFDFTQTAPAVASNTLWLDPSGHELAE